MSHKTINREESVDLFHRLMQPESEFRILRLLGDAKLGKSHLATKVFPSIARRDYGALCAVIDLRSGGQAAADVLHTACGLLGGESVFQGYYAAYREWLSRPKVQASGLLAVLSYIQMQSGEEKDEVHRVARHLTSCFVGDLHRGDVPMLFLFDSVNDAEEGTRRWLMDVLLVQLSALPHVRVIVSGRSLPEACGSYADKCRSFQLLPVDDEEAYIAYCREIGAELEEQSIRDIAKALKYNPGMFVDLVIPTFVPGGAARG